jgi:SAM-dependent methyltransferase
MRVQQLNRLSDISLKKTNPYFLVYVYLFRDLKFAISKYAGNKILDIGCGNKPYEEFFDKNAEYVGCDIIQSNQNKVDIISLATKIPLEDETFDTIFSTQTIEHVFDHELMLKEAFRLVKNNGMLIISGPMYWPHHEVPFDFFRFTEFGFRSILEKVGFSIVEVFPNGGKWALWGLATIHTFPSLIANNRIFKFLINSTCYFLDKRNPDFKNTSNFVIVAKK